MTIMVRYAIATFICAVSLALSSCSLWLQVMDHRLIAGSSAQQVVPLPGGVASATTAPPPFDPPLTTAQRNGLTAALVREPLSQRYFNILYVDLIRTRVRNNQMAATMLLARLGWRLSIAQVNLMLWGALNQHYGLVADRAEALLRRQKFVPIAVSLLAQMEATPIGHGLVVRKLRQKPYWKKQYLSSIQPNAPRAMLLPRIATLRALLASSTPIEKSEIAPTLMTLLANGHERDAYDLWRRWVRWPQGTDAVADGRFEHAAALFGSSDPVIPFEWQFRQDLGYAAVPTAAGVTINWDGRGVPAFMTQQVPVQVGARYLLTITGNSGRGPLGTLLAPSLACGQRTIAFTPIESPSGRARYRSDVMPDVCDIATLAIDGQVDTPSGEIDITIRSVTMTRSYSP